MKVKIWHSLLFYLIVNSNIKKICESLHQKHIMRMGKSERVAIVEKTGETKRGSGEKRLTLASSGNDRRSVVDLKTAVCCFL